MIGFVEQVAGALIFLLGLGDVFLTVLYARAGTGLLSRTVTGACWRAMLTLSQIAGRSRGRLLSFCGPLNLALLVFTWSAVLILGAALIVHPELGRTVEPSSGPAQTDFVTALYVGGSSLSLVGSSGYTPQTGAMRLLFLLNAVVGTSVLSLTLTYLMQVYTALRSRNALGLAVDTLTRETGDAVQLLTSIAPGGDFSAASSELGDLASQMIGTKEAHHFYPVLFYFRFDEPRYSVSRFTLIVLDAVSLLRATLDGPEAEHLKRSGAVEQLHRTSLMLVRTLERTFLSGDASTAAVEPDRQADWRDRCSRAMTEIAEAGLPAAPDRSAAEAVYLGQRAEWDADVSRLAPALGYALSEIDVAVAARTQAAGSRERAQ